VENVVWEGHDAVVELGRARDLTLVATGNRVTRPSATWTSSSDAASRRVANRVKENPCRRCLLTRTATASRVHNHKDSGARR
jgi:hypothetical protein